MEEVNNSHLIEENNLSSDSSFGSDYPRVLKKKESLIESYEIQQISIEAKVTTERDILNWNEEHKKNNEIVEFIIQADIIPNNGTYTWNLYKTYKEIRDSFSEIRNELFNSGGISFHIESQCKHFEKLTNEELKQELPQVAIAYQSFFQYHNTKNLISLREYFNISNSSFNEANSGIKPLETIGYKEAEPRIFRSIMKMFCYFVETLIYKHWNKRWIVLRNDMICYLNESTAVVGKNVYWFDEEIKVFRPYNNKILQIENMSRKLTLRFSSSFESEYWMNEIKKKIRIIKKELEDNAYRSFTSQKDHCNARWFVDGKDYFSTLLHYLLLAKETVFITDWWLSPEMFLKRPVNMNIYEHFTEETRKNLMKNPNKLTRLMDVLNYIAEQGVTVYILVYSEVSLALTLNSKHTKTTLNGLHQNIKVTRHPKKTLDILWSHHEKLVIIDQKIAFVGGLDICWGRYDTHYHPIVEPSNLQNTYEFPVIDYSNARIRDFSQVEYYLRENVPRENKCRMPWHDVHAMLEGPVVADVSRHFVERWNHARFDNRNMGIVHVRQASKVKRADRKGKVSKTQMAKNLTLTQQPKFEIELEKFDKNYIYGTMAEKSIFDDNDESYDNLLTTQKNLSFINLEENIKGNNEAFGMEEKDKDKDKVQRKVDKKITIMSKASNSYKKFVDNLKKKKVKDMLSTEFQLNNPQIGMRNFKCQVLRSVSNWSIGKNRTENSILQGYYKLIDNSKHYLYIENQFFISKTFSDREKYESNDRNSIEKLVENEIGLHIRARIQRAYEEEQPFRVFIFIPLLPGFEGEIESSSTMSFILKHTYKTISRNYNLSIYESLFALMGDKIDDYLIFLSLRNHDLQNNVPVTELIYIHSKLMIVDDEKVLIGSANINDRSMLGDRDSEFAVIIEEDRTLSSFMNGNRCFVSNYASGFRKALMAEHLGINQENKILIDPLSDELFNFIKKTAKDNTLLYRKIFNCYPDDIFTNFEELAKRKIPKTEEEIQEQLKVYLENKDKIKGHCVQFPLNFLKNEELGIRLLSKENFVPEKNFT